jgi:hypothetical protein
MTSVLWIVGVATASALVAIGAIGGRYAVEILAGMLAPLAATTISWTVVEQTFTRRPEALSAVMIQAFAAKVVFFGAYVAMALSVLALRPKPFVVSFTSYFITLYAIEAFLMQRLFRRGPGLKA